MMIQLILYLCLTVGGMALFKMGSGHMLVQAGKNAVNVQFGYLSLLGIACYGCSFLLWLWIVREHDLSVIFPVMNALAIVLTALFGMVVLHENVSTMKLVGIAIILVGVLCVGLSK